MQPPISPGTVLQSRYRALQLLGQGGFGRTYLAEDLGRFNERCAIKEFVPQQGADHFSSKATELFQREANILYQIQHPQIPQFRATFEQDQRLFLVQDYVEGTNYRDLLNQRLSQGMTFSEAEVRQFLQQMLPVLAHIHAKGIIHRDISPDNIIRRHSDGLPVLIDFGVVKEVVTRLQHDGTANQATTVGKLGYAPSEQMQSGRAYPSSDLYSLAATAVVLLTGREPQELFDDVNLTWHWQRFYTNASPGLTQVLNKALSYRPGDRYQSVSEMAQALGVVGRPGTTAATVAPAAATAAATPSQMRTVAVGRAYQPTRPVPPSSTRPAPSVTRPAPPEEDSIWENPIAVTAIGVGLALLAGLAGLTVVRLLNRQPGPVATSPVPSITVEPTTPTPGFTTAPSTPTPARPVEYSQQLALNLGESRTLNGTLRANETVNYQFQAQSGQQIVAQLEGEGVLLTVLGPNGEAVDGQAQRVLGWQGALPDSGQYVIQLSPVQGLSQSNYTLNVSLEEAPAPEPAEPDPGTTPVLPEPEETSPAPDPGTTPAPQVLEQRVQIPGGETSVQVTGSVGPGRIRRYVINAQQGQVLSAETPTVTGPVRLDVRYPGGEPVPGATGVLAWQGQLPVGGDFIVDVQSANQADYTLLIEVE
ncbi:MAG TPA: serine/threonine-protein kinase [Trichocoleus sp.]